MQIIQSCFIVDLTIIFVI